MFTRLRKEQVKYVYLYGHEAWGWAGLHNYVVARLMWNPAASVDSLFEEWLQRAYGQEAAVPMGELYDRLEVEVGDYKRTSEYNWQLTTEAVKRIYLRIFPEMEQLYGRAWAAPQTDSQRARLAMFGDNLILLHWNLRKAGLLKDPEKSAFYRSDDDFRKFAERTCNTLAVSATTPPKGVSAVEEFMRPKLFAAERKTARIPQRRQDAPAPVIDGDLSDALWKNGAVLGGFVTPGDRRPASQPTEARVLYDAENLYLAFRCAEDQIAKMRTACQKRDDPVLFADDCVEIFLGQAPNAGGSRGDYWHVAINSAGVVWDDFQQKLTSNLGLTCAAKKGENAWTLEIAILLKNLAFGDPAACKTWRCNLAREEKPHAENSAWDPVEKGFLEPENFGVWEFIP